MQQAGLKPWPLLSKGGVCLLPWTEVSLWLLPPIQYGECDPGWSQAWVTKDDICFFTQTIPLGALSHRDGSPTALSSPCNDKAKPHAEATLGHLSRKYKSSSHPSPGAVHVNQPAFRRLQPMQLSSWGSRQRVHRQPVRAEWTLPNSWQAKSTAKLWGS